MSSPAAHYSARETLRDGRIVEIRALHPNDQADMILATKRISKASLYRRFFGPKQRFSDREIAFFINVDFDSHVALIATIQEAGTVVIVGGGRFIRTNADGAELAFVVIDAYQGKGVGKALLHHLLILARTGGLHEVTAEVLLENRPMLAMFDKAGFERSVSPDPLVVHVRLPLVNDTPATGRL